MLCLTFGLGVNTGIIRLYQIAKPFAMGRCLLDDYQDSNKVGNIMGLKKFVISTFTAPSSPVVLFAIYTTI